MNLNLTYECWKDVKVGVLHWGDHTDWPTAIPFLMLVWGSLNTAVFLLVWWLV
jgi:hypothetical protein